MVALRNGQPTKQPLLMIAASGLARETLAVARAHGLYNVIGFLDDSPKLEGATIDGVRVLGSTETVAAYPDAQIIVCAGRGAVREKIVARLTGLGVSHARYASIIHPVIELSESCRIGSGSIVLGGVVMTTAVTLGDHVVVMPNATLTHDCILEDYSTVCAGVALGGNVVAKRAAYLGMKASVREGVTVGSYSTLGMGSALLANLPDGETWAGVPARGLPPRVCAAPEGSIAGSSCLEKDDADV